MATLVLQNTYKILQEELKSIDNIMKDLGERIKHARELGDLKENAEYHAAREEMSLKIYKKQLLQSHAPFRIIEDSEIETDEVGFGVKVTICEDGKDELEEYYILGPIEFDLDLYPIIATYHSPFGQAIIGKKVNQKFTLEIKGKKTQFTVISIEEIPEK